MKSRKQAEEVLGSSMFTRPDCSKCLLSGITGDPNICLGCFSLAKNWAEWTWRLIVSSVCWNLSNQRCMLVLYFHLNTMSFFFLITRVYLLWLNILNVYILRSLVLNNACWSSKTFFEDRIPHSCDETVKTKYSVPVWPYMSWLPVTDKLAYLAAMSISSRRQALNTGEMVSHHLD